MSDVVLTGFCDEVCADKNFERQLAVAAAVGLEWVSLRFFDLGGGIKNILAASDHELGQLSDLLTAYGLRVSSIGSPLGKVKLCDVDDGTSNTYRPFTEYLAVEVRRTCEIAAALRAPLIRGFSFYPPRRTSPDQHLAEAAARLREIARQCAGQRLIFGLEVEANLVGHSGELVRQLIEAAAVPNLLSIFDGANLVVQGYSAAEVWRQYLAMRSTLGWVHIKDHAALPETDRVGGLPGQLDVDEESPGAFVPAGWGAAAYRQILPDLKREVPAIRSRLQRAGWENSLVFLDLEPHLRKGGQFGGLSGADGFGIALRQLCQLLEKTGVSYQLRDWPWSS